MTVSTSSLGTCLLCVLLHAPHMTGPSSDPWKHCGLPQLLLRVGKTLGYMHPHVSLPLPFSQMSGRPIRGSWHIQRRLGDQQRGQNEVWVLQEGWCNLIGGHSCINRGIEEFLSAWWNWLCMNGPSSPPKWAIFHMSQWIWQPLQQYEHNSGTETPAQGSLSLFSSCEILPLWLPLLKTSSKSCCLTCQKQPYPL